MSTRDFFKTLAVAGLAAAAPVIADYKHMTEDPQGMWRAAGAAFVSGTFAYLLKSPFLQPSGTRDKQQEEPDDKENPDNG